MHNEYFEGVLQLRAPTDEVIAFIHKEMEEHGRVRVTKELPVADGMDLYLTDQRFIQQIARKLSERFGGQVKVAPRLFSKDKMTSRNVYRVNALFRMPSFERGDEINVNGKLVRILSVKKMVQVQDVATGQKSTIPFDRVQAAAKR